MIVSGYACHFNKRNDNGEIVLPTSFNKTLKYHEENNLSIPINFNHNENLLLGKVESYQIMPSGLFITASLNDEVDTVKNFVKPLVKDGTLNRFSTEGLIKYEDLERISNDTYIAKEYELKAVAIVAHPADLDAFFSFNSLHGQQLHYFNAFEAKKKFNKALYII